MKLVTWTVRRLNEHLHNRLFLNSYLLILMRLIGPGGSFVFWALAARTMSASELGLASGAVTSAGLLAGLAQMGAGYVIVRYLPRSTESSKLISLSFELVFLAACVLGVCYLVGLAVWSPELLALRQNWGTTSAYTLLIVSYALFQLLNWIFLARLKPVYSLLKNALQTILSVLFLLVLAKFLSGYISGLLAYAFSIAAGLAIALRLFLPASEATFRFQFVRPEIKWSSLKKYALANYIADQIQRSPDSVIPLLVINLMGSGTGAFFFVAWTVTTGLQGLTGAISPSLFAEGANRPEVATAYAKKSVLFGLVMAGVATLFMLLAGPFILSLFGAEYRASAGSLLLILTAAIVPGSVFPIFLSLLRITDRLRSLIYVASFSLLSGISFVYAGSLLAGLNGAGAGWFVSRLVVLALILVLWRRQLRPSEQRIEAGLDAHSRSRAVEGAA